MLVEDAVFKFCFYVGPYEVIFIMGYQESGDF